MHACMHTYMHTMIYTYIHSYIHTYTHTHTYIMPCFGTRYNIPRTIPNTQYTTHVSNIRCTYTCSRAIYNTQHTRYVHMPVSVKKGTPPESHTHWEISFQSTRSCAGLRFMLRCRMAKAHVKGVLCSQTPVGAHLRLHSCLRLP